MGTDGLDFVGTWVAWGVYLLMCWPMGRRVSAGNFLFNRVRDVLGEVVGSQRADGVAGMRYGHTVCGRAGCGGIAVYNALTALGLRVSLAEILYRLEQRRCAAAGGYLGTHPFALGRVLRLYPVRVRRLKRMPTLAEMGAGDVAIAAIWNDRANPLRGAHFFTLRQTAAGFAALNREGTAETGTLAEILGRGRFITAYLVQRVA